MKILLCYNDSNERRSEGQFDLIKKLFGCSKSQIPPKVMRVVIEYYKFHRREEMLGYCRRYRGVDEVIVDQPNSQINVIGVFKPDKLCKKLQKMCDEDARIVKIQQIGGLVAEALERYKFGDFTSTAAPVMKHVKIWEAPAGETIKLNVDAAMCRRSRCCCIGVVARNADAICVGAWSKLIKPCDVEVAECTAVLWALQLARERGWNKVSVESNSSLVPEPLHQYWSLLTLLEEIRLFSTRFTSCAFSRVGSGCNGVARALCQWGLKVKYSGSLGRDLPDTLLNALAFDSCAWFYGIGSSPYPFWAGRKWTHQSSPFQEKVGNTQTQCPPLLLSHALPPKGFTHY